MGDLKDNLTKPNEIEVTFIIFIKYKLKKIYSYIYNVCKALINIVVAP